MDHPYHSLPTYFKVFVMLIKDLGNLFNLRVKALALALALALKKNGTREGIMAGPQAKSILHIRYN